MQWVQWPQHNDRNDRAADDDNGGAHERHGKVAIFAGQ